ncbi:MAG TPA: ABC transporter permease subunit [Anaerolineales bacterium]|nr:ABC transporter permease subunit [Anaerolineales bacterium]
MLNPTKNWTLVRRILLVIACIPLLMFLMVVANLLWNSRLALSFGLPVLFSDKISTALSAKWIPGQFGLLPAIVGTIQVVILSLLFSLPFSLVLALAASEYSLGWLSRPIELLMSIFNGIPDILYALMSVFVVTAFIRPKFAAIDLDDSLIRTLPGLPPYSSTMLPLNQSTLLGAIFLALLIIPFMAPLILDSIRNVPQSQREASISLGATRWFTLQRIILPGAMPGIIGAISLGVLKAAGDVIICAWTIGFIKDNGLPNPLWDFFERNAPLTATGTGLVGGLFGATPVMGPGFSAANFAALLLLVFAFAVLGLAGLMRRWLNRRYKA